MNLVCEKQGPLTDTGEQPPTIPNIASLLCTNFYKYRDPSFSVFPTYPLVLQSKGSTFDVNVFAEQEQVGEVIPGLPEFDINRMVHGEQQLEILRQPPVQGEFWLKSEVTGVFDKGWYMFDWNQTWQLIPSSGNTGSGATWL